MFVIARGLFYFLLGAVAGRVAVSVAPDAPFVLQMLIAFVVGCGLGAILSMGWKKRV